MTLPMAFMKSSLEKILYLVAKSNTLVMKGMCIWNDSERIDIIETQVDIS